MKQIKLASLMLGLGVLASSVAAQEAKTPSKFLRSSIYTVLLRSSEQDKHFDEECAKESSGAALVKGFAGTDAKRAQNEKENGPLSAMPQKAFLEIAIPDQFNNFNQEVRVIDFEKILPNLNDADKAIATAPKKKSAFGAMAAGLAKEAAGIDIPENTSNEQVNQFAQSVINHFAVENAVAPTFVGKWFDYGATPDKWDFNYLIEMGLYDANPDEIREAQALGQQSGIGMQRGMELMNNTYLIGVNLRFRSNAAIVAEAEKAASGLLGGSAASMLSAAASAAAGEGFTVEAVTYLFKLVWDQDKMNVFATDFFDKHASMEELVASGLCKLEYLGQEKAKARVRMSITNTKPMSDLVKQATERAIDSAIAKLQVKYDVFRTSFPILEADDAGNIYAEVGMKEGISKGDEYDIVLPEENPKTGKLEWKKVGSVKAVDKQIWDNRAGAAEEAAEDGDAEEVKGEVKADKGAVALGKTTFAGAKKGKDYSGHFLRLKKKK